MGPMKLPDFFPPTQPLPESVLSQINQRGTLSDDRLTVTAATRPGPFKLPSRTARAITMAILKEAYNDVEIDFGGPGPGAAPPPPAPIAKGPECTATLREAGITSRKDFTRWALRNHPDKGGDTAMFQRVSACVDTQYGSARKTRRKGRKATRRRRTTGRR